jgi:hypothetical protein
MTNTMNTFIIVFGLVSFVNLFTVGQAKSIKAGEYTIKPDTVFINIFALTDFALTDNDNVCRFFALRATFWLLRTNRT